MIEEIKQKVKKWSPFSNRQKTLMCREQVLSLIEDVEKNNINKKRKNLNT